MYYISSLSGGVSSAIATELTIKKYGRNKVKVFFADTLWEDKDLYRFIDDLMARWGGRLYKHTDGRTPAQVAEQRQIIPNNMMAPCTYELKIKPFEKWLVRQQRPVTVIMGFNWEEQHRIKSRQNYTKRSGKWKKPTGYQQRFFGVYEDYPLLWEPWILRPFDYVRDVMGIEIPRAYIEGFGHNNCLGRGGCFKGGQTYFKQLKYLRPDNFEFMSAWENNQRFKNDGKLSKHTILRHTVNGAKQPLPLSELEEGMEGSESDLQMDMFNCVCGV